MSREYDNWDDFDIDLGPDTPHRKSFEIPEIDDISFEVNPDEDMRDGGDTRYMPDMPQSSAPEFSPRWPPNNDRNRRRKKRKKGGGMMGCLKVMLMLLICLNISIVLAWYLIAVASEYTGVGKESGTVTVTVEEGDGLKQVAAMLKENGIIKRTEAFKFYADFRKKGDSFQAGTYIIDKSIGYDEIIYKLKQPDERAQEADFTIVEGYDINDIIKVLLDSEVLEDSKELEFRSLCNSVTFNDRDFVNDIPSNSKMQFRLEGYLFPNTHTMYQKSDPEEIIRRLLNDFEYQIDEAIEARAKEKKIKVNPGGVYAQAEKQGMSLHEIITLASIIQKEAGTLKEMRRVSSVFHNRLNNPQEFPKLESDATYYYPYKVDTAPKKYEGPYSTYKVDGLPMGPICSPGIDAIVAALYPSKTDFFFFCSDEIMPNPTFYYAYTLEEHEINMEIAGVD